MTTANPISEIEQRKVFDELEPEVRQRVERDMMELNDDRPYIMAFTRWSKSKGKYVDELDTDSDDDWPDSDDAVDDADDDAAGNDSFEPDSDTDGYGGFDHAEWNGRYSHTDDDDADDADDADEQRQPDADDWPDVALQFHRWGYSVLFVLD